MSETIIILNIIFCCKFQFVHRKSRIIIHVSRPSDVTEFHSNVRLNMQALYICHRVYLWLKSVTTRTAKSALRGRLFQEKCQSRFASGSSLCSRLETKRRSQTVFPKCIDFSSSLVQPPLTFHRCSTAQSQ